MVFEHEFLGTCCFGCLICCVIYFCTYTCSAQLNMFHMERRSRNKIIIIIIIIVIIIIVVVIHIICYYY